MVLTFVPFLGFGMQSYGGEMALRVFMGMLNEGILMTQRGLGACSLAMGDDDVDRFVNALARVLARQ
jgi:glutamate-1-semialdehyde aminotransferase